MLSLKHLLQTLPADALESLRKEHHLKADDADHSRLAQRIVDPDRARHVFASLDSSEKSVLRYLLSQAGYALETEIVDRLPDSPLAIAHLRTRGMVFADPDDASGQMLCIPRELQRFISLTPAEKVTSASLLSRQPPAYMSELPGRFGWTPAPRPQLSALLKRQWLEGDQLQNFVSALDEPGKALWRAFVDAEGTLDLKRLQDLNVMRSAFQPGSLDLTQPLDRLYAQGLVFPNQWPNPSFFIMPSDILNRQQGSAAATHVLMGSPTNPAHLRSWGLRLLSDLQYFSAYQSSSRLQFTQNGIPMRHQLRVFLKALGTTEETYGLFLNASMAAFLSAVIKRETGILSANPAESMSRVIAFWRDGEAWQESSHWRDAKRSPEGRLDKTLKAKRLIVLQALQALPAKQWVAYSDFENFVFATGWKRVDANVPRQNAYYHNERWPRKDYVPDLSPSETLAAMTAESLVWLGLVEVGTGRARKTGWDLTHLRLTEWGRQFLDKKSGRLEPLPQEPAETQFRVLPNLEIQVSPRLKPDLLTQLFKIAALSGIQSFAMTKESLRQALDEGMTLPKIIDFLKSHSSSGLPELVQQFVSDVGDKHGHIKLGFAGAYLEVDDPLLLTELRAHKALKDFFKKQVADRLALLTHSDLQTIAKILRKHGYSPVIQDASPISSASVKVHW